MIELATGKFPYATWKTPFEQLKQVVNEAPPKLPAGEFSAEFDDFIVQWYVQHVFESLSHSVSNESCCQVECRY